MRRTFETALNALILTACFAVISVVVYSRVGPGKNPQSSPMSPPKGQQIEIAGVQWNNSRRTVVLVLNTHCHFCTASASFYQHLQEVAKARAVPIVAVLPQPIDEAQSYLEGLHVPIAVVRQSTLSSVQASATPTLMILNSEGKVTDSWVGQLSPKVEEEVISKF